MKLNKLSQVALAVIACMGAASASANVLTVSNNSNVIVAQDTDWADFLNFQKFNSSLGTLTSVKIDLYSDVSGSVDLTNYNSDPVDVPVSLSVNVALDRPDSTNLVMISAPLFSETKTVAGNDVASVSNSYVAYNSAVFTNASDLALFTGAGNISTLISAHASSSVEGDGVDAEFTTKAGGHGTVTYTYTAAPVPEPETYGMLLLGLGMMGVVAKRKQARKA
jgi:hypothetical protein